MAVNFNTLFKKETLTGKQVGRAMLQNNANAYWNQFEMGKPKPVLYNDEWQEVMSRLASDYEARIYQKYVNAYRYIMKEQSYSRTYSEIAQAGISRMMNLLGGVSDNEKNLSTLRHTPLVMTQKQFDFYKHKALKREEEFMFDWIGLFVKIYYYYMKRFTANLQDRDNPLHDALTSLAARIFTSGRVFDGYRNSICRDLGHYITKDGYNQEEMTEREWDNLVDDYMGNFFSVRKISGKEDFYDTGIDGFFNLCYDANRIRMGREPLNPDSPFFEYFTFVKEDIKEVRGSFALERLLELYGPSLQSGSCRPTEEMAKWEIDAFKKDFPELYEAVMKIFRDFFPDDADKPCEEWSKPIISMGTLMERGLFGEEICTEPSTELIALELEDSFMRCKALNAGIAILHSCGSDVYAVDLDDRGFYEEPQGIQSIIENGSIIRYSADEAFVREVRAEVELNIEDSLREVYAFNEVLKLIEKQTGVDTSVYRMNDIDSIEKQIHSYNVCIMDLRRRIASNTDMYESIEDAENRYKLCCQMFPLIDVDMYKPTEADIMETAAYIKDFSAYELGTPQIVETMKRKGVASAYDRYGR